MLLPQGCNYLRKKGILGSKKQLRECVQQLENAKKEDSAYYSEQLTNIKKNAQSKIDSLQKACENANYSYYVITGSFRNPNNSQAFANKMLQMGYKAEILLAPNGFNLVSAFGGNNLKEVTNALTNLKTNVAEDSWIYAVK